MSGNISTAIKVNVKKEKVRGDQDSSVNVEL